jgi:hypothetical protein
MKCLPKTKLGYVNRKMNGIGVNREILKSVYQLTRQSWPRYTLRIFNSVYGAVLRYRVVVSAFKGTIHVTPLSAG